MKVLINSTFSFVFWTAFILFVCFLQNSRLGEIGGIAPDFLLIVFFIPLFFQTGIAKKAGFILAAGAASAFFFPFWLKEVVLLGILALSSLFLKRFLFDRPILDFALLFFFAGLAFYLLLDSRYLFGNFSMVLKETGLSLVFAAAISPLFIFGRAGEDSET